MPWLAAWALTTDHVSFRTAFWTLEDAAAWALFVAVGYMALEPSFRRRWPWRIISWNRLLAGRLRDPLVGRDVLIGGVIGVFFVLVSELPWLALSWTAGSPHPPSPIAWQALNGLPAVAGLALDREWTAISLALLLYLLAFLLLLLCRRPGLAVSAFLLCWSVGLWMNDLSLVRGLVAMLALVAVLVVLMRTGLLTLVVALYYWQLLGQMPITYDFSAWYARQGLFVVLILVGLTLYGFLVSLGGRPLFRDAFFQEG